MICTKDWIMADNSDKGLLVDEDDLRVQDSVKELQDDWRCKILEEEKSKFCEQNKCLQSALQLHLEKETSMSLELQQLRNKFTESEKKFHSLQNENLSLASDCEKMKTQLETSAKTSEDVELLMQSVKEKDKEIAELRAQLIATTEQHSYETREAEKLRENLQEMEEKYQRTYNELYVSLEKLGDNAQEICDLRCDCDLLMANLHYAQKQLGQSKSSPKDPASDQLDPAMSASPEDSHGEKAVAEEISHIPRRILCNKDAAQTPALITTSEKSS